MMLCRHCEPQFRPTGNTNLPGRDSWSGACQKTSHGTMPRSNTSKSSSGPSSINLMFGKKKESASGICWRSSVLHPFMSRRMSEKPCTYMELRKQTGYTCHDSGQPCGPCCCGRFVSKDVWCSAKSRWMTVLKNKEDAGSGPVQASLAMVHMKSNGFRLGYTTLLFHSDCCSCHVVLCP
jgi:hypothetical protein